MKKLLTAFILLLLTAITSYAEMQSLDALMTMQVIKSGTFLGIPQEKIPGQLTLITSKDIENSGSRNVLEAVIKYVESSEELMNKWGSTILSMNSISGDINGKIILCWNGLPLNFQARDGVVTNLLTGSLNNVERIEVLSGASGFVYGSGSFGGVINIVTKDKLDNNGVLSSSFGGYREGQYYHTQQATVFFDKIPNVGIIAHYGFSSNKGVGIEHSYIYGDASWPTPGFEPNYPKSPLPAHGSTGLQPASINASLIAKFGENVKWSTQFSQDKIGGAGYFMLDPFPEETDDSATVADANKDNPYGPNNPYFSFYRQGESWREGTRLYVYRVLTSMVEFNHSVGEYGNIEARVSYLGADDMTLHEDMRDYGMPEYPGTTDTAEIFGEHSIGVKAVYKFNKDDRFFAALGTDNRFDMIGNGLSGKNSSYMSETKWVVEDVNYVANAVFLEGLVDITDWVALHGGIRYDRHTLVGNSFSPKASAIFTINGEHIFKFIYQTSSNNPTADAGEGTKYVKDENNQIYSEDHLEYTDVEPTEYTNVLPGLSKDYFHGLKPEYIKTLLFQTFNKFGFVILTNGFSYNMAENMFMWDQGSYTTRNAGAFNYFNHDIKVVADIEEARIKVGAMHNWNRIVNTDLDASDKLVVTKHYVFTDSTYKQNNGTEEEPDWEPVWQGGYDTNYVNAIKNSFTKDGKHFLNKSPQTTKFFVDYEVVDGITIHTDAQVYWDRLKGRAMIIDSPMVYNAENYWYDPNVEGNGIKSTAKIEKEASIKFNLGVTYSRELDTKFIDKVTVSVFGRNILANRWTKNYERWDRNALVPQQMASGADGDLFLKDQASVDATVKIEF